VVSGSIFFCVNVNPIFAQALDHPLRVKRGPEETAVFAANVFVVLEVRKILITNSMEIGICQFFVDKFVNNNNN